MQQTYSPVFTKFLPCVDFQRVLNGIFYLVPVIFSVLPRNLNKQLKNSSPSTFRKHGTVLILYRIDFSHTTKTRNQTYSSRNRDKLSSRNIQSLFTSQLFCLHFMLWKRILIEYQYAALSQNHTRFLSVLL